jgi:hypothetical protein
MENVTFITGEDQYLRYYKSVFELSEDRQRRMFYGQKIHSFQYITRKETDTHIYWAVTNKTPKYYNNKLFFYHKNTQGVTYTKKTKSVKVWFGEKYYSLSNDMLSDIYNHLDCNWIKKVPLNLCSIINNTIFNNIIKGKVTNVKEICKAYIKSSSYKNRDIDIDLYIKTFTKNSNSPKTFTDYFIIAKDCNHLLKFIIKNTDRFGGFYNYSVDDFVRNAMILNKPVDFKKSKESLLELNKDYIEIIKKEDIIYEFFKENSYD